MTKNKNIILFGAGGHGKVVLDVINASAKYSVLGFIDDGYSHKTFCGLPVFHDPSRYIRGSGADVEVIVCVGDNRVRAEKAALLKKMGLRIGRASHPTSVIAADARVGYGTTVMAGAIINTNARIGPLCIINTGAIIDHDCVVGKAVHLCPGVTLAGEVTVGEFSTIYPGAVIGRGVTIGADVTVGAGSVVITNVPDRRFVCGIPAKEKAKST
ncbi:MAG TPA: acetyltransferase [Syntrophales bacterium]|nr:acetyltransferase [Syntrophales bacterium]